MSTPTPEPPVDAPGWHALDRFLGQRYGDQLPHQFTSRTAYNFDSESPLPAISVYEAANPLHWHYVSYGFSELFETSSPDEVLSGFGLELTLRIPRAPTQHRPPVWGLRLLQGLARYVFTQKAPFDTGHRADLGSPLAPKSALKALACIPDPELGNIQTPFGKLLFLQVVGLTTAEYEAMKTLGYEDVVLLLAEIDRLGLTDPARGCWTQSPQKSPVFKRFELGIRL